MEDRTSRGVGKPRDLGLDAVRALAAYLVLSVHFFLNTSYYDTAMLGKRMLLLTVVRTGCMVCVPLFLLLTGCLCRHRRLSRRYYRGLGRILATYVLASLACQVFRHVRELTPFPPGAFLLGVLDFTAAPYAWYIEMYIGLFLLIPFLSLAYEGLTGRRQKLALMLTMGALTALPAVTNISRKLLPSWWTQLYPIAYYFIGAYLGEYRPRVRWRWGLPLLAAAVLSTGAGNYLHDRGHIFLWMGYNDWYGPGIMAAVLVFLLVWELPWTRAPRAVRWPIHKGSELSLGIYLVSWCFDAVFYPMLNAKTLDAPSRWPWFPVIVPVVYLCSALTAQVIEWCRKALSHCATQAISHLHHPTRTM